MYLALVVNAALFLAAPMSSAAPHPRAALVPQAQATDEQLAAVRTRVGASKTLIEVTPASDGVTPALTRAREALRRFALDDANRELEQAREAASRRPCNARSTASARVDVALIEAELALASGDAERLLRAAHDALASQPELTLDEATYPPPLLEAFTRARSERSAPPTVELVVETVPSNGRLWLDGAPAPARVEAQGTGAGRRYLEVSATPHWLCASLPGWRPAHLRLDPQAQPSLLRISLEEELPSEPAARLAQTRFDWQAAPEAEVKRETGVRPMWKRPMFWVGTAAVGLAVGGALLYLDSRSEKPIARPPDGPKTSVVCCQ